MRRATPGNTSTVSVCRSTPLTRSAWAGRCCAPMTGRPVTSSNARRVWPTAATGTCPSGLSAKPYGPLSVDRQVDPKTLSRTEPLAGGAKPAQPLDQQRVVGEGLWLVDQRVEHLVVASSRHLKLVPDRLLFGPGELPPLPLEGQDLAVP